MVNHHFVFLGMSHRLTIKLKHLTELTLALSGKNTDLGGVTDYKNTALKRFPVRFFSLDKVPLIRYNHFITYTIMT